MAESLLSAEDLLAKMRAGVREVYEIRMRQLTIQVRMLTLDERLDIRNRMMMENAKMGGDQINLAAMVQKETLRAASILAKGQVSVLSDRLLAMMTLDEVTFLYNEYQKLCDDVNPNFDVLKPEQFNALVEAIQKKSVTVQDLNISQLKAVFIAYQDLIQSLALRTQLPDNGSGTPPSQ